MTRHTYNLAHDAMIRRCATAGHSYSKAAETIGEDHSRHAIAGRARRLGVKFTGKAGRPRKSQESE